MNMKENEAIKEFKQNIDMPFGSNISREASGLAIQALEKQIPKRPDIEDSDRVKSCKCPLCGGFIGYMVDYEDEYYPDNYCPSCGQKLDWSEE